MTRASRLSPALCLLPLALQAAASWTFDPPADLAENYAGRTPVLDLRTLLNEPVAGAGGFVRPAGDHFVNEAGTVLRFWGVSAPRDWETLDAAALRQQARLLARRGVNLVRLEVPCLDSQSSDLAGPTDAQLSALHRAIGIYREAGIYTQLSLFKPLEMSLVASWGLEGFTAEWLAANADKIMGARFGLLFVEPTLQAAHRAWLAKILTQPVALDGGAARALKDEPALALVEFQNEDNLFCWTFDPNNWPLVVQQRLGRSFAAWLTTKYGSLDAATLAWGTSLPQNPVDDFANGVVGVASAGTMARTNARTPRIADQIRFLAEYQRDFYAALRTHCETGLGARCSFTASNWVTAADKYLLDADLLAHAAAGVTDAHDFHGPQHSSEADFSRISSGDWYANVPAVKAPERLPVQPRQIADTPAIISEGGWTHAVQQAAEGPLLVAGYAALQGLDGWNWYNVEGPGWTGFNSAWSVQSPALLGQFPAAALIYRRGDVAPAPVVIREHRDLTELGGPDPALSLGVPTQNIRTPLPLPPDSPYPRSTTLRGRVLVDHRPGADWVDPVLDTLTPEDRERIVSLNEETALDVGQGLFGIDTPRATALVGFTGSEERPLFQRQVQIKLRNAFGSVAVVSLDGQPLMRSQRLLVQACAEQQPQGSTLVAEARQPYGPDTRTIDGVHVQQWGSGPYQLEPIDGEIRLLWNAAVRSITVLDANGYAIEEQAPQGSQAADGYRIALPVEALYTVIELDPPENPFESARPLGWTWIAGGGWCYHYGVDPRRAQEAWFYSWTLQTTLYSWHHPWIWIHDMGFYWAPDTDLESAGWIYFEQLGWCYLDPKLGRWYYSLNEGKWSLRSEY